MRPSVKTSLQSLGWEALHWVLFVLAFAMSLPGPRSEREGGLAPMTAQGYFAVFMLFGLSQGAVWCSGQPHRGIRIGAATLAFSGIVVIFRMWLEIV